MDDEVRLIDANALKETLKNLCSGSNRVTVRRIEDCMLHDIFPRIIDDEPTIEAEPVDRWISVKDRLPDKSQRVFVFYKALGEKNRIHNDVMATNWRTNKGDFIPCDGYKVTHWQPLPEPPKGE